MTQDISTERGAAATNAAAFARLRVVLTVAVTLGIWSSLLWQRAHDGVPSHSFMAREDFPEISNWWGALVLPVLTIFATGRMQARLAAAGHAPQSPNSRDSTWRAIVFGFVGALLLGASLATAFTTGNSQASSAIFLSLPLIGILVPIYRAEFILGFVLGMCYTFGSVLPLFIASVIATTSAVAFLLRRAVRARFSAGV